MSDTSADPAAGGSVGAPANFSRHDVDVDAPDSVVETEQATFDRHDVEVDAPDSVDEVDEATFDRHDGER